MKTSVVHPRAHGGGQPPSRLERLYLPAEKPDSETATPRTARFFAAHVRAGTQVISIDPWKTRPYKEKVPDSVLGCPLERGKSECVRVIPDSYRDALHDLDERIDALHAERFDLVAEAYRHGRPLRKSDVVTEEKGEAS